MASHRDTPSRAASASINAIRSGDIRTPTMMLLDGMGVTVGTTLVAVKATAMISL